MNRITHFITVTGWHEYRLIILEGEFSLYNVHELKDVVFLDSGTETRGVIIDMKGVSYMDSSAIGVLYSARKKMTALGRDLFLSNISRDLNDVMQLAGISFNTMDLKTGE